MYIFDGERDLSSLPCLGEAGVQISLKIGECCVAIVSSLRMTHIDVGGNLLPNKLDSHGSDREILPRDTAL